MSVGEGRLDVSSTQSSFKVISIAGACDVERLDSIVGPKG
jgi:hypothetical protein